MKKTININPLRVFGKPNQLSERVTQLARCLELSLGASPSIPSKQIEYEFASDNEKFFADTLLQCEEILPRISAELKVQISSTQNVKWIQNSKWIENEFGNTLNVIQEHFEEIALASPKALIECLAVIFNAATIVSAIPALIVWFIRYADSSLITRDDIINKIGHSYYREYVARLPADQLHEYFLSENVSERIIAKNKYQIERAANE